MIAKEVINALKTLATEERRKINELFFKTNKGQYGYGDIFLGVRTPDVRNVAKRFSQTITLDELTDLIKSPIHEVRLCALIILVNKYNKEEPDRIYKYYLKYLNSVNNWDLVDTSAPHIVGNYLYNNPEKSKILLEFSHSENLWVRRISIVSTLAYIKNNEFNETLEIAKLLLNDEHDLIHKAVGWMLREVYKRDEDLIKRFLRQNYAQIPRTTLRYAIERMDKEERLLYLKGNFDVSH